MFGRSENDKHSFHGFDFSHTDLSAEPGAKRRQNDAERAEAGTLSLSIAGADGDAIATHSAKTAGVVLLKEFQRRRAK